MLAARLPLYAVGSQPALASPPRHFPCRCLETETEDEKDSMVFETPEDDDEKEVESSFSIFKMPGISEPLGFFDPAGFSKDATEGKIKFFREVELKHSRIAMLAALGFPLGEQFHPLFGGEVDVPSYIAFQETPLQTFWPIIVIPIAIFEVFSIFSFNTPFGGGELWSIRSDFENGDFGFDPMGLEPETAEEFKEMQTKVRL